VRIPSSQLEKLREFEELTVDYYGVEHNIQQLLTSVKFIPTVQKLEHSNAQLRFALKSFPLKKQRITSVKRIIN